jgi:glycosyltransferase involved in cell wall biosynthesis
VNILFITSRLPFPPYRGDKSRTFNLIKALSKDHRIVLVSFYENRQELIYKEKLMEYCTAVHLVYLPKWFSWAKAIILYFQCDPSQSYYYWSYRMSNLISRITRGEKFDIAYIHLFRMFNYAKSISPKVYIVTDLTDVVSKELFRSIGFGHKWKDYFVKREAVKIRNYERVVTENSDEVWVVSEQEKNDLMSATFKGNIHVVKIGVVANEIIRKPVDNTLLFFGYSSTGHNRDALIYLRKEILPRLKNYIPDVVLNVFGAGKWQNRKIGKDEFPVVHYGFIKNPEDLFSKNLVMVAPIVYSAGTQTKILEAMNNGIPVVTSDFGNEGIGAIHEKQIIVCSSADEYVTEIRRLLTDRIFNEYIGLNGQKYVRDNFSWDYVTERASEIEKTLKSQNLKPVL